MSPQERKEQIKALWQKCFEDSDDFVTFYFDRVYRDTNALSLEKDGRVVSALQMIPYTMSWCGMEITVAYISGACTDPAERGKGLMGELLQQSFREMRKREYDITALIPANASLFDYYRAYGYTEVFDYSLQTFESHETLSDTQWTQVESLSVVDIKEWFAYFDLQQRKHPCAILHTEADFRNNLIDTLLAQGLVLGIRNYNEHPVGIAFITTDEGEVFIKEMFYASEEIKEKLLFKAAERFGLDKVVYKTPALLPNSQRHGMAMILAKDKMIRHWLHTHPDALFTAAELNQMDPPTLARHLFGYDQREAYMSLMMD